MIKYLFFLFLMIGIQSLICPQILFESGSINGGITAGAFSAGRGAGQDTLRLHVPPGASINKVGLFFYKLGFGAFNDSAIFINGHPISVQNNEIVASYIVGHPCTHPLQIIYKDVTHLLDTTEFVINLPPIS